MHDTKNMAYMPKVFYADYPYETCLKVIMAAGYHVFVVDEAGAHGKGQTKLAF